MTSMFNNQSTTIKDKRNYKIWDHNITCKFQGFFFATLWYWKIDYFFPPKKEKLVQFTTRQKEKIQKFSQFFCLKKILRGKKTYMWGLLLHVELQELPSHHEFAKFLDVQDLLKLN
jgi:hypothetical protein